MLSQDLILERPVEPFHHAVRSRMPELDGSMLNVVPLTDPVKRVDLFSLLAPGQGFVGKLKAIVGQDVVDLVRVEVDDGFEEPGSCFFVFACTYHNKGYLGDTVNRGVNIPPLPIDLGGVE